MCFIHDYQHLFFVFDQCAGFEEGRVFNFHLNFNLMENSKENRNLSTNLSFKSVADAKKKRVQSAALGGRKQYPVSVIMESVGPYQA